MGVGAFPTLANANNVSELLSKYADMLLLQIVHPSEFSINLDAPEPLGRIQANTRLLEAAGWNVVNVPATSLHSISSERTVIKDVGRILQDLGLPTDWKQVARASPR